MKFPITKIRTLKRPKKSRAASILTRILTRTIIYPNWGLMSSRTVLCTTVNGKWGNDLDVADSIGTMVLSMKAIGEITWPMVKVDLYTVMGMFILVSGKMIRLTVTVHTSTWMGLGTRVTGSRTNNTVLESKAGLMELNTKEIIIWVKKMVKVNFSGLIIPPMKAILAIIVFTVKVSTSGLMVESTRENGKIIKWTVFLSGEGEFTWQDGRKYEGQY
jgi:hypothetical protein